MSFELPSNNALNGADGFASVSWLQWFNLVHQTVTAARQSGTTANRPDRLLWIGRRYFDATLGKPVYLKSVKPAVWVDASGATV